MESSAAMFPARRLLATFRWTARHGTASISYVQGQSPSSKVREYFYFIDHQGQLFLDDVRIKNFTTCFKEKKFLQFFFSHLRKNELDPPRYPEFPFISPCGRELNYIRCEDRPIIYTELMLKDGCQWLSYNFGKDLLKVTFDPALLSMDAESGRVYYPSPKQELGRALIKSSLADELSPFFEFEDGDTRPPRWINWNGQRIALTSGSPATKEV